MWCRLSFGQLSTKTVRKILRDAYKHLKSLGNINRVPLNSGEETVTVVSPGVGAMPSYEQRASSPQVQVLLVVMRVTNPGISHGTV